MESFELPGCHPELIRHVRVGSGSNLSGGDVRLMAVLRKLLPLIFGGVLLLSAAAGAGDEADARDSLRDAARSGDVAAQLRLADEFFFGRNGRLQNPTLAAFWFRRAAEAGNAAGAYNLAVCLEHGWGVERDLIDAFRFYSQAASEEPEARLRRALLLYHGIPDATEEASGAKRPGIPADREGALRELGELHESGHPVAGRELAALIFHDPELLKTREAELRPLLERAVAAGDPEAMTLLGEFWRRGVGGPGDAAQARVWWERAATAGAPEAMMFLAGALEFGQGGAADPARAYELVRKAAEEEAFPAALVRLGDYYLEGDFVKHDPAAAVGCFEKALAAGYFPAATRLGDCRLRGIGGEADPRAAAEYYGRAARGGDPDGEYKFGRCYLEGTGMNADPAGAVYWFRRAAAHGQVEAMRELGVCLISGKGVPRNETEGSTLLEAAAAAGDSEARLLLNR